jgi:N-acetylmuramoyl-L-alanine amidase
MTYLLDPGHPNESINPDSDGFGAVYDGEDGRLEERQLNYEICKKIQSIGNEHGVRVELTRGENDPTLLQERCQVERDLQPEIFCSVHFNWFSDPEVRGSTIFYYEESGEGKRIAESLTPYFDGYLTIPHRRTRITESQRDDDLTPYFYVLSKTASPAVLLELAFLSNPDDRQQILNERERFVNQYAQVIFWGLRFYSNTKGDA